MLLAEDPSTLPSPAGEARPAVQVRLHGGRRDGELVSLEPGKFSVGSGPRCSIQIQEPGVQPLQCLISFSDNGLRVRRWADGTFVNGAPFDESELSDGDVISVGSVQLEVVAPREEPAASTGDTEVAEAASSPSVADELAAETAAAFDPLEAPFADVPAEPETWAAERLNLNRDRSELAVANAALHAELSDSRKKLAECYQQLTDTIVNTTEMEQQLADCELERQKFLGERSVLQQQITHSQSRTTELERRLADATDSIKLHAQQAIRQQQQWLEVDEERASLRNQVTQSGIQVVELQNELACATSAVAALERQVNYHQQAWLDVAENGIDSEQKAAASLARVTELERERSEAVTKAEILEQQLAELNNTVDRNTLDRDDSRQQQSDSAARIAELESQLAAMSPASASLQQQLTGAQAQLTKLKSEVDAATVAIQLRDEQLATLQQTGQRLVDERSEWQAQSRDWDSKLADRERSLAELKSTVESLERQLSDRHTSSENVERERSAWESRLAGLEAKLAEREQQLATAHADREQQPHEFATAQAEASVFADERRLWQERTELHHSELASRDKRIAELTTELQSTQPIVDERAEWMGRATKLERELSELRQYDEQMARELDAAHIRIEELETVLQSSSTPKAAASVPPTSYAGALIDDVAMESAPADLGWTSDIDESVADAEGETAAAASEVVAAQGPHEVSGPTDESLPPDVEKALAHMRELSIWRQNPVEDQDLVVEEEGTTQGTTDAVVEESSSLDEPPSDEESAPSSTDHSHDPQAQPSHDTAQSHSEEESIEDYMAKLMQRLRGNSLESPVDELRPSQSQPEQKSAILDPELIAEADSDVPDHAPAAPRTRVIAPEFTADMTALRALANQSARHAIGIHTARKLRRNAFTRFITALLGGVVGLYFLLESPGWDSLQFVTSCVATLTALYWGQLTFRAMMQAIRSGAFEEFDDFVAIDGSQLPLPIDVNRQD